MLCLGSTWISCWSLTYDILLVCVWLEIMYMVKWVGEQRVIIVMNESEEKNGDQGDLRWPLREGGEQWCDANDKDWSVIVIKQFLWILGGRGYLSCAPKLPVCMDDPLAPGWDRGCLSSGFLAFTEALWKSLGLDWWGGSWKSEASS
jgi:hypothetical protein